MRKLSTFNFQLSTPKGFTLVEMVIVIAIMAILVTGVIVLLDPLSQLKKGRDGQRKSDLRQIQSALEMYRSDQGGYPDSIPNCSQSIMSPDCTTSTYVKNIPTDPNNTGQFIYNYLKTGTTYILVSCLENVNDSQKDATNNSTYCTGGTTNWSYTLQNP